MFILFTLFTDRLFRPHKTLAGMEKRARVSPDQDSPFHVERADGSTLRSLFNFANDAAAATTPTSNNNEDGGGEEDEGLTMASIESNGLPKSKRSWTCPCCRKIGNHLSRMHQHTLDEHWDQPGVLNLLQLSIHKSAGSADSKRKLTAQVHAKADQLEAGKAAASPEPAALDAVELAHNACAQAVVSGSLSYNACQQPWFKQVYQAGLRTGFDACRHGRAEPHVDALWPSRGELVDKVEAVCVTVREKTLQELKNQAEILGLALVEDGRSNIRHDSLLVYGFHVGTTFYPFGSIDGGAAKKDATFLREKSMQVLSEAGVSHLTFSAVVDGAPACLKAGDLRESVDFIVSVRCQSHAVALLVKHIVVKCFEKEVLTDAEFLITHIRNHPRLHTLIKVSGEGLALLRVVDTRFLTHVIAVTRLVRLKPVLEALCENEWFLQYKADLTKPQKLKLARLVEIIKNKAFWDQADFFLHVTEPMAVACRLMDQSAVRACDVNRIWESLAVRLALALDPTKFTNVPVAKKLLIFTTFTNCRKAAHRPVFDAAFILDPRNRDEVRTRLLSRNVSMTKCFAEQLKNTEATLMTVIKRGVYVELKTRGDEFQAEVAKRFTHAMSILHSYLHRNGQFCASNDVCNVQDFWLFKGLGLGGYATIILNMGATVSDVERLHKLYSLIHTATRASLGLKRVDALARATYFSRMGPQSKPEFKGLEAFESTSLEQHNELVQWGESLGIASLRTRLTIANPTFTGSAVVAPESWSDVALETRNLTQAELLALEEDAHSLMEVLANVETSVEEEAEEDAEEEAEEGTNSALFEIDPELEETLEITDSVAVEGELFSEAFQALGKTLAKKANSMG